MEVSLGATDICSFVAVLVWLTVVVFEAATPEIRTVILTGVPTIARVALAETAVPDLWMSSAHAMA